MGVMYHASLPFVTSISILKVVSSCCYIICCSLQVAGGKHLQHNREVGENPAQSRYCNWYAAYHRGVLSPSSHCSYLNGKARCVDIGQKPGDLPADVACEVLP